MKTFRRIGQLIAIALIVAPAGAAHSDETKFVRIATDDQEHPIALQLAIVTYKKRTRFSSLRVDLVSAIHIGDQRYYAELNKRFETYDALLYELVAPHGTVVSRGTNTHKGFVSNTQLGLTRLLNLSFQLEQIEYDRPNFVHADLSATELSESMDERGESLYVYFWRLFYASIHEYAKDPLGIRDLQMMSAVLSSDQGNAFKTMLAYEMTNLDQLRSILGEDSDSAVIGARNQRAIDVLQQQIDNGAKRIGIFYGVAHMPDMEQRLRTQLQLVPDDIDWVDAWRLGSDSTSTDR